MGSTLSVPNNPVGNVSARVEPCFSGNAETASLSQSTSNTAGPSHGGAEGALV